MKQMPHLSLSVIFVFSVLLTGCPDVVPPSNRAPAIQSLTASKTTAFTGETIELTATAQDPDGDILVYAWQTTAGTLDSTSGSRVNLTAPSTAGTVTVTVTVSDTSGAALSMTKQLTIQDDTVSPVSNFRAVPGNGKITLMWSNPSSNFAGTMIRKKPDSYPAHKDDGVLVYNGTATDYTDTDLENGTKWYYMAYAYNVRQVYSMGTTQSATPSAQAVDPVKTPEFSVKSGTYIKELTVVITTATPGASIRYTLDGSVPSASIGQPYVAALTISESSVLQAIAYKEGYPDSNIAFADYVLDIPAREKTAAPEFSLAPGKYTGIPQSLTISSDTAGALIKYTMDGTDPKTSDTVLTSVGNSVDLELQGSVTLKAYAEKEGYSSSDTVVAVYDITLGKVSAPVLSKTSGTYAPTSVTLTISCSTADAVIRYTTDGTTPTEVDGQTYSGEITLTGSTVLKVKAFKKDYEPSDLVTGNYVLSYGKTATPTVSPQAGTYSGPQSITLTTSTEGASIHYTLDGTLPTAAQGTLYEGPFSVDQSAVVKAAAFKEWYETSDVVSASYVINYEPTFTLKQGTTSIASSGEVNFGDVMYSSNATPETKTLTFLIKNTGNAPLELQGSPAVAISGANAGLFSATQPAATLLQEQDFTEFSLSFTPDSLGIKTATVTIENNDQDFTFTLKATGAYTRLRTWTQVSAAAPFLPNMTSLSFNDGTEDKLWLFNGNSTNPTTNTTLTVMNSSNGSTWASQTPSGFNEYNDSGMVVMDDVMYKIGGWYRWWDQGAVSIFYRSYKDIIKSQDGINWVSVTPTTEVFTPRHYHQTLVFQNKIYILGGVSADGSQRTVDAGTYLNDVWVSEALNAASWSRLRTVTADGTSWSPRIGHQALVFGGKIWVLGGKDSTGTEQQDIWYSTDGITWVNVDTSAFFGPVSGHKGFLYDGKMWLITKAGKVWYTDNGSSWKTVTLGTSAAFGSLSDFNVFVKDGKVYLTSGSQIWVSE